MLKTCMLFARPLRHIRLHRRAMADTVNQSEAIAIDQQLFNDYQFSVDQLMELAGLACAQIVAEVYALPKNRRILCLIGPGNNGGDGLGYSPSVYMCGRAPSNDLMKRLVHQTTTMNIPHLAAMPTELHPDFDVIVDALFGFSFRPPVRAPFDDILRQLARDKTPPIASIDIPSGWNVETGPDEALTNVGMTIRPDLLISLTAPKQCARHFHGAHHYLGGRFVPEALQRQYAMNLPVFPGSRGYVKLS